MERQVSNGFAGASSGSSLGDDSIEKGPVMALFVICSQAPQYGKAIAGSFCADMQLQETAPLRI